MDRNPNLPTMDKLIKGRAYRIRCRNLSFGVWDGVSGFIGIRTKFGSRYLFTELHWDADRSFGTVRMATDLGIGLPPEISAVERLGVVDQKTNRPVEYKPDEGWFFKDTGEFSKDIWAMEVSNKELFKFLDGLPEMFPEEKDE
jgi:hypothetical protein